MFLAMCAAMIGIVGGVLYVAIRRWLPGPLLVRATSYGALLLAVFGFVVMDDTNRDYQLFGPTWLNVVTFSLTYIVFGVLASLLAEWLDARVVALPLPRDATWRTRLVALVLSPFAVLGLGAIGVTAVSGLGFESARVMFLLMALVGIVSAVIRSAGWTRLQSPSLARLGYASALLPALFGVYLTLQGIVGILTG
jgi:hypothetical protein